MLAFEDRFGTADMTGTPNQTRKPFDAQTYAALRSSDAARSEPPTNADADLVTESERLGALRDALWSAFEASPSAELPNVLIDLTIAYTNSLRLQLSMKGWNRRETATKAKVLAATRRPHPEKI